MSGSIVSCGQTHTKECSHCGQHLTKRTISSHKRKAKLTDDVAAMKAARLATGITPSTPLRHDNDDTGVETAESSEVSRWVASFLLVYIVSHFLCNHMLCI